MDVMDRSRFRLLLGARPPRLVVAACGLALLILPAALGSQSLRGSRTSLAAQHQQARRHDFTHLDDASDVRRFVSAGLLVPVRGNRDLALASVSFPYARPQVKTFVERLARQYRQACGEKLVVTSLTRPRSRQPRNASHLSVHPTGMALDLRRSKRAACRTWLEGTLLALERRGVLEATRERWPAHYHVAVFPAPYQRYVASLGGRQEPAARVASAPAGKGESYRVGRGDSLWTIAQRHGTTVAALKSANGIASNRLKPGQVLRIPGGAKGGGGVRVAKAPAGQGTSYRVGRGDSLWTIAQRHGTTVAALKVANGISSTRLKPGQVLAIPASARR